MATLGRSRRPTSTARLPCATAGCRSSGPSSVRMQACRSGSSTASWPMVPASTTAAHVPDLRGFGQRTVVLERDVKGTGPSMATRHEPSRGVPMSISAAAHPRTRCRSAGWGSGSGSEDDPGGLGPLPELTVVKEPRPTRASMSSRTSTRAAISRPSSSVDDDGLVGSYADWQRTGFAMGPDDTEPLDAGH